MINGSVKEYAVKDPYITGYALPNASDVQFDPQTPSGYFLIDTKTGLKREGMNLEEWMIALKSVGWNSPKLESPRNLRTVRIPALPQSPWGSGYQS